MPSSLFAHPVDWVREMRGVCRAAETSGFLSQAFLCGRQGRATLTQARSGDDAQGGSDPLIRVFSRARPFRHEAFLYAGDSEYLAVVERFVREGIQAGEAVLVAVPPLRAELVRRRLGPAATGVLFADLDQIGSNPARLIPLWRSFLDGLGSQMCCRGIAESVHPGRHGAELEECLVHESLVNLEFAGEEPLWLLCPYDSLSVSPETIEDVWRSHPYVSDASGTTANCRFAGPGALAGPHRQGLAPMPAGTETFDFEAASVVAARHLVSTRARSLGLTPIAHLGFHPCGPRGHREQHPARRGPCGRLGVGGSGRGRVRGPGPGPIR